MAQVSFHQILKVASQHKVSDIHLAKFDSEPIAAQMAEFQFVGVTRYSQNTHLGYGQR